jgi:hypothetical protein
MILTRLLILILFGNDELGEMAWTVKLETFDFAPSEVMLVGTETRSVSNIFGCIYECICSNLGHPVANQIAYTI